MNPNLGKIRFDRSNLPSIPANFDDKRKSRLQDIRSKSPSQFRLFMLCYKSQSKKAAAIKAKCLDCCCYQRTEVELCEATACPLWNFRPFKG